MSLTLTLSPKCAIDEKDDINVPMALSVFRDGVCHFHQVFFIIVPLYS